MSDNTEKDEVTTKTDAAAREDNIPPEVFDSSTYNSMTDLKRSAIMGEDEPNKVLSDTENKEPIEPEDARTTSTTNTNVASYTSRSKGNLNKKKVKS
jgi:hypothetical protein